MDGRILGHRRRISASARRVNPRIARPIYCERSPGAAALATVSSAAAAHEQANTLYGAKSTGEGIAML
jgi:hypothetical protein